MNRKNSLGNRPSCSPPSPPQFRSPATGYSKSILSAIKDLHYEPSSGNTSRSSANSTNVVQSPPPKTPPVSAPDAHPNLKREEKAEEKATTTILKIKVGQFSEEGEKEKAIMVNKEKAGDGNDQKSTESGNKRRERRSISCEASLSTPANAIATPKSPALSSLAQSQKKTQSVNNLAAATPSCLPAACSTVSSQLGSCASIQSTSTIAAPAGRRRSPSVASSICSKDEKSSASFGQPKIPFSTCAKALDACSNGKLKELRELVHANPDLINYQYPYCFRLSCLHIAAKSGHFAIVNYLLKSGANLNAKDDTWSTPLHAAAKAGELEMVKLLREMGADKSIRDAHGCLYTAYLPPSNRKQVPHAATVRSSSKAKHSDMPEEDASSLNSNRSQHSFGSSSSRFNHSFHSFRKPITRAVRDLLHRK